MKGKFYKLLDTNRKPYWSETPGTLGGHRRLKGYGRLDCPSALMWIAKGYYVRHRVFFADEATAMAAGYRPCARCMPERYQLWRHHPRQWRRLRAELAGAAVLERNTRAIEKRKK